MAFIYKVVDFLYSDGRHTPKYKAINISKAEISKEFGEGYCVLKLTGDSSKEYLRFRTDSSVILGTKDIENNMPKVLEKMIKAINSGKNIYGHHYAHSIEKTGMVLMIGLSSKILDEVIEYKV